MDIPLITANLHHLSALLFPILDIATRAVLLTININVAIKKKMELPVKEPNSLSDFGLPRRSKRLHVSFISNGKWIVMLSEARMSL